MDEAIAAYLALLKARSRSPSRHGQAAHLFERLLLHLRDACSLRSWSQVTAQHLVDFALAEARLKTSRRRCVSPGTYRLRISILRGYFAWLHRTGRVLADPSDALTLPKAPGRLPPVPSQIEIARLIETPDIATAIGLRDRALMETLYATGIRHREVWNLDLYNIDLETGRLTVRQGKGGHDRVVPLTENACRWLGLYIQNARPELTRVADCATLALWLSRQGRRLGYSQIGLRIAGHAKTAGVRITVHGFRHACGTHLLRHGADIRHIQRLLGHQDLDTTELYTRLEVADLAKALESAFARLGKRRRKPLPKSNQPG
jgi:integrase/recombinase XerD